MSAATSRRGMSKGDQRERALLVAARDLMRRKPLQKITIDELARSAGIARPGFYFYFDSKQALLAASVDEVIGEVLADMTDWLGAEGPARSALRAGLEASLARWRVDGPWLVEALVNPNPPAEFLDIRRRALSVARDQLVTRLDREIAAGRSKVADRALTADMIITFRNAMLAEAVAGPATFTDDVLLDGLTDAILRLAYVC